MLQHALPAEIRRSVIDQLFNDIVSVDQSAFAEELYLTPEQIRVMYSGGMEFGSHTHSHPWLDRISLDDQETEISTSIKHLQSINIPMNNWIMCYPYGASSHETRVKSMELGAKLGLGSQVGRAHLDFDDPMRLPRWDANDVLSGTLDLRFN
jgi:peptidoglycan/xylan/chitin deacetylase (PgdA/CDA1 family)